MDTILLKTIFLTNNDEQQRSTFYYVDFISKGCPLDNGCEQQPLKLVVGNAPLIMKVQHDDNDNSTTTHNNASKRMGRREKVFLQLLSSFNIFSKRLG